MKHFLITACVLFATSLSAQTVLTLDECLDRAARYNRDLQSAALKVKQSREQNLEAKANRLPQISANVMAFQAFDKMVKSDGTYPEELGMLAEVNPAFGQMVGQPYSIHEMNRAYGVTASVIEPIYVGGKITAGVKLTSLQHDVAVLQEQLQTKEVAQKVTENFWNIAAQKYRLRTLDAAQKQLEAVYNQVDLFVKAGVTTRNQLLQVKLRQQELASNRLKVENGEKLLLLLLAQQIGLVDVPDFDIALPPDSVAANLPVHADSRTAAMQREEAQLAAKNVEAQQLQVKLKRADMLPTLSIGLMGYHTGLGGFSDNAKRFVPTHMTNALALATLSVPISEWWGKSKHSVKGQRIAAEQAEVERLAAQEQLAIDVESAWLNLVEAHKQIDIARASQEEANENFRMNREQHRMGTTTLPDLLDAETLQRQAADDYAVAVATYQIRLADYRRKTGGAW